MIRRVLSAAVVFALCAPVTAKGADEQFGWLPPDTRSFLGASPAETPLLNATARFFGPGKQPSCWPKRIAEIDRTYQVWADPGDSGAVMARGRFSRAPMEKCIAEAITAIGFPAQL